MLQPYSIIALAVVASLSIFAYLLRFLTASGALAASFIGGVIILFGGIEHFSLLLIFFIVSSLFTKFKYGEKYNEKNNALRSWNNVFGNGIIAALALLLSPLFKLNSNIPTAMYIGAISAAFSDTMATEIGMLSRGEPVLVTNPRRRVNKGAPGGVTFSGYVGVLSAILILWVSTTTLNRVNRFFDMNATTIFTLILLAGVIGTTFDSFLGAVCQSRYSCKVCGKIVETKIHCGENTLQVRGWKIVNNDVVNILNTLSGALVGYLVYALYS